MSRKMPTDHTRGISSSSKISKYKESSTTLPKRDVIKSKCSETRSSVSNRRNVNIEPDPFKKPDTSKFLKPRSKQNNEHLNDNISSSPIIGRTKPKNQNITELLSGISQATGMDVNYDDSKDTSHTGSEILDEKALKRMDYIYGPTDNPVYKSVDLVGNTPVKRSISLSDIGGGVYKANKATGRAGFSNTGKNHGTLDESFSDAMAEGSFENGPENKFVIITATTGRLDGLDPIETAEYVTYILGGFQSEVCKPTRSGEYLVKGETKHHIETLLKMTEFVGRSVQVRIAELVGTVRGVIYEKRLLNKSAEYILDKLRPQGIVKVRPLINLNKEGAQSRTPLTVLTFKSKTLPKTIKLGSEI